MTYSMNKLLLALGLVSNIVIADYTTTLLFAGLQLDSQAIGGYVGSVISTDATATTYSVTCPAFVGEACGIPASFTITQGPSTMHYAFPTTGGGVMTAGCKITTDHGVCSGSILATGAAGGLATVTYSNLGTNAGAVPVTITAGGSPGSMESSASLAVTSVTTKAGTSARQTAVSSSGTSSGITSSGSTSATGSPKSSEVSTGGMPMMTGQAHWVIGGAAAVVIAAF